MHARADLVAELLALRDLHAVLVYATGASRFAPLNTINRAERQCVVARYDAIARTLYGVAIGEWDLDAPAPVTGPR